MNRDMASSLSVTEANQNFSIAEKRATANGSVVLLNRNRPKYILIDLDTNPQVEMTDDEKIAFVARRIQNLQSNSFNTYRQGLSICSLRSF